MERKARPIPCRRSVCLTPVPCIEFDSPLVRGFADARQGQLKFDKHRIRFESKVCAENPRICFANPHRLRPPAGALARGLKTLTPCTEFDSPRCGLEIKRQVDISIYLPVTYGGAYEKNGELHKHRQPRSYPA